MLSKEVTDLLSIKYEGLFDDKYQCDLLLMQKRDSGDADTPPELTQGHILDLSEDLFCWVAQQHLDNNTGHLVARDIMSNISAGLSGSYGKMVDMLAEAGLEQKAAQIWRADVADHMSTFREFLRVKRTVDKYNSLSEDQKQKPSAMAAPDSLQREIAADFPAKKQRALDAIQSFKQWLARYNVGDRHDAQIALWKEELQTEKKPKLPPADKTPMCEDLFWEIIARAQCEAESETVLKIEDAMATYVGKSIRDAAKIMQSYDIAAYREDIWGLAYLLQDGCSDDAFDDFRSWMILRGRTAFDTIITAPGNFDPSQADGASFETAGSLQSAFENAYLSRTGKPLILPRGKYPKVAFNEDKVADLLPNVSAKLNST